MNIYDNKLEFKGTWRVYQKRVLDSVAQHWKDDKIHIVAAPGSGKTTLGIELIKRKGMPCLIISPSLVIKNQWIGRIKEAYLKNQEEDNILSGDIRKPALITSTTYQSFFCGMNQCADTEGEQQENSDVAEAREVLSEKIDYTGYHLIQVMKEADVQVLCLDECHHLKQEWWKALENFVNEMPGLKIISLTATPPYDSTPAQWERYSNLCGPIDEEIVIPELVKEGSLCPHQDYVFFNYPTREEEAQVQLFYKGVTQFYEELMAEEEFTRVIASHKGLNSQHIDCDCLLDNPEYLSAMLIYRCEKGITYPTELLKILGVKNLPPMDEEWMQCLLQGLLFDDTESYEYTKEYYSRLLREMKTLQLIVGNKVALTVNEKLEKMLIKSKGKQKSIHTIIEKEYASMGQKLRAVILTDYIKKEYNSHIGDVSKPVDDIGVIPIFEMLRRNLPAYCSLGVLCGTQVILSVKTLPRLLEYADEKGVQQKITTKEYRDCNGQTLSYMQVGIKGDGHVLIALVTQLFESGSIHVLIGTKSLLGEGWDAPSINTLIMATTVGSFVLSNQMRGRAIRTKTGQPEKVSNVWHLVSLATKKEAKELADMGMLYPNLTVDYVTLERRMDSILGLHYEKETIESGMQRLTIQAENLTKKGIERWNADTLQRASKRDLVKEQWEEALFFGKKTEIIEQCKVGKKNTKQKVMVGNLILQEIISLLSAFIFRLAYLNQKLHLRYEGQILMVIAGIVSVFMAVYFGRKILRVSTPVKRMKQIGEGILLALKLKGEITSRVEVFIDIQSELYCQVYLAGGTIREKTLFAKCLAECCGIIDNQRYLLAGRIGRISCKDYFVVPELFSRTKADAQCFQKSMQRYNGTYPLIYTRNVEGRKVLLEARRKAFFNRGERMVTRQRKIKGALE